MVSPLVARETAKEVEIGGYLLPKVNPYPLNKSLVQNSAYTQKKPKNF